MKYKLLVSFILTCGLWGCGAAPQTMTVPLMADPTRVRNTPAAFQAETAIPTPTIGYQSTAFMAQQTADAASRMMVEATAQHEQNVQDQLVMTAQAEQRTFQQMEWTATAAPTSIAATATQQEIVNMLAKTQQANMMTSNAMTITAPTMIVAMRQAEVTAQFAMVNALVKIVLLISIAVFMIGFGVWLVRASTRQSQPDEAETVQGGERTERIYEAETVIAYQRENAGYTSQTRLVIPCSRSQLTELAEGLINGGKSLAINQWEGKGTLFTRPAFLRVRHFLQDQKFARNDGHNTPVLTAEGDELLRGWLDREELPQSFDVSENDSPTGENAHNHENHARNHGGGGQDEPTFYPVRQFGI